MKASMKVLVAVMAMFGGSAFAGEALPLPEERLTRASEVYDTFEEITAFDSLVVVGTAVGEHVELEPGFTVVSFEIEDLWIADVDVAGCGHSATIYATQPGTTRLVLADKDGWTVEYQINVEPGVEPAELAEYEVVEGGLPVVAEAAATPDAGT